MPSLKDLIIELKIETCFICRTTKPNDLSGGKFDLTKATEMALRFRLHTCPEHFEQDWRPSHSIPEDYYQSPG